MKFVVVSVLLSTLIAGCASTVDEEVSSEMGSQEPVVASESDLSAVDDKVPASSEQSSELATTEPLTTESIRMSELGGPEGPQLEEKDGGQVDYESASPLPVFSGSGQAVSSSDETLTSGALTEKPTGVDKDLAEKSGASEAASGLVISSSDGADENDTPSGSGQQAENNQQDTTDPQVNADQTADRESSAEPEVVTETADGEIVSDNDEQSSDLPADEKVDAGSEAISADVPRTKDENAFRSQYRLGTGDVISIRVFNEPDMSMQAVKMTEAGSIQYVFLGEILVSGLTTREVEQLITERLRDGYLRNPRVTVTVDQYRPYYIGGEVVNRGSYPYVPGMTVLKAITIAGGFAPRASKSKIFLSPENSPEQKNKVSPEDPIAPGDVITIEESFF